MALQFESQPAANRRMGSSTEQYVFIYIAFLMLTTVTVDVLPMATEMAGVNMRLEAGAIR